MAIKRIGVFNEIDPAIGITFEYTPPGTPGRAQGWYGSCTECPAVLHFWRAESAFERGQQHVDRHAPVVIGIDPSSVVR